MKVSSLKNDIMNLINNSNLTDEEKAELVTDLADACGMDVQTCEDGEGGEQYIVYTGVPVEE